MARFAPVVPLNIASWLQSRDLLGDYHLLLAHDVLADPPGYRDIYGHIALKKHGVIILDNSVIELGKPMGIDLLMRAVDVIQPKYLVVPDAMGHMDDTIDLADAFTREYQNIMGSVDGPNLLAVVHGETIEEHRICAKALSKMPRVTALSAPRMATKTLGSRMPVVCNIRRYHPDKFLHLLGFSDDILDDVACAKVPGVAGIDSAVPIRAATRGQHLKLTEYANYGPRGDFWNTSTTVLNTQHELVYRNINDYRTWIDTTHYSVE